MPSISNNTAAGEYQGVYDILIDTATGFWEVMAEMAPYLLLGFLVAGILSVAVPPRFVERHLGGRGLVSILKAALLGIPLPLCSCGVIPVAASLRRHGASKGATASFLLSTPQTGIDSLMVTYSLLGPVFAIFRPIAALVTGLFGGQLIESLGNSDEEQDLAISASHNGSEQLAHGGPVVGALKYGFVTLPQDIGKALVVGLLIAGLISAVVPDDFFFGLLGAGIASMLVMMLIGVPVYVCATASVPIAAALIAKGISPGAALVFLVTGPATNAAAITTIWRVLGKRSTFLYLGTVAVSALASGLILDQIIDVSNHYMPSHVHSDGVGWFGSVSAIAIVLILGYALLSPYFSKPHTDKSGDTTVLRVGGMTCNHCAANVKRALGECSGVESVEIDLKRKSAFIKGASLDLEALKTAVENAGYNILEG